MKKLLLLPAAAFIARAVEMPADAVLATSATEINGAIIFSGQYATEPAWRCFNKEPSRWLDTQNNGWIVYQFANGDRWAVTNYILQTGGDQRDRDPAKWLIEGSNDLAGNNAQAVQAATWTPIDARAKGVNFAGFTAAGEAFSFPCQGNETAYAAYRLSVTNSNPSYAQFHVGEWEMQGYNNGALFKNPGVSSITPASAVFNCDYVRMDARGFDFYLMIADDDYGENFGAYTAKPISEPAGPVPVTGLSPLAGYCARLHAVSTGPVNGAAMEAWSDPVFFTTTGNIPIVESLPAIVSHNTAMISANLLNTGVAPTAVVTLHWGPSDCDTGPWPNNYVFPAQGAGAPTTNLAGLAWDTPYYFRHSVNNGVDPVAWSDATLGFEILGSPALGVPSALVEIANNRAILSVPLLDTGLAPVDAVCWFGPSGGSLAPVATWIGLAAPQTLVCTNAVNAPGAYQYAFSASNTMIDNTVLPVWTATNTFGFATEKTWTGNAHDNNWDTAANWSPAGAPGASDTAIFNDAGLSGNPSISLGADQAVYKLRIHTALPFTIGASGETFTLTLTDIERAGVNNAEGLHVLAAPVLVAADANGGARWTLDAAGNTLRFNGGVSASGSALITKDGAGALHLNAGAATSADKWRFNAGAVSLSAAYAVRGSVEAGGGETPVALSITVQANQNAGFTLRTNATLTCGNVDGGVTLHLDGGRANVNGNLYAGAVRFTGGHATGNGAFFNIATLESLASPKPSTNDVIAVFPQYANASINAADGAAPIDLVISRSCRVNSWVSTYTLTKGGAGTVRVTTGQGFRHGNFAINNGVWLCDNPTGSGTGVTKVTVNANGTLGGTGFSGGNTDYNDTHVTLDGNSGAFATLAPGTIDPLTGEHVVGTLTVGSLAQTNNVAFNAYSRLRATLGPNLGNDRLDVHGAVTIAANTTLELLTTPQTRSGVYTLATAENGVIGEFTTILLDGEPLTKPYVVYDPPAAPTSILLRLPSPGAVFLIR